MRRPRNVDFPKEYEGFWAKGICGHAADFNHVVLIGSRRVVLQTLISQRNMKVSVPKAFVWHAADFNHVVSWVPVVLFSKRWFA